MKTRFLAHKIAIVAITACFGCAQCMSFAVAQEVLPPGRNSALPSASALHTDLATFLDALSQRYQVRIVLDPGLEAPTGILRPDKNASLTTTLNSLTRQMKNAAWQRVFVQRDADLPNPEKLAAAVRALSRLPPAELLVENPSPGRGTLLLALPRSRTPEVQAETDLLDTKPIYVLYNTALPADGKTALERITDGQQQQLNLLAQLPPDQRPNPARLGQRLLQNLRGNALEAAMRSVGGAGMTAWQNTAPEARNAMIQQFITTVQNSPPLEANPAANPPAIASPSLNHIGTLRSIADMLAKKYHVRILIDPALNVPAPPTRPSPELTLAQALEVLTKSVPDSAWRGVYQKSPTASAPSASLSTQGLAAIVRTLDAVPLILLQLENGAARRTVILQADLTATALPAKLTAHAFATPPTYLIYATQDAVDSSLSVAQRLEQMQMEQMDQLLTLNPDEMTQAMNDALAQYSGGTGETPGRMMRLPIMALLMGTWFPQKAKEH